MNNTIQGLEIVDFPKNLKDWELWHVLHNHEIGIRTALTEDKAMDSKWQMRSWHKTTQGIMEKHGHNSLDIKKCKCYLDVIKARGAPFLLSRFL